MADMTVKKAKAAIKKAMEAAGTYNKSMEFSIALCAGAYVAYINALDNIEGASTTITTVTREGNKSTKANPAYRVFNDNAESFRKSLRELGLTAASIIGTDPDDEVNELKSIVNSYDKT